MIKTVIIDDERHSRVLLRRMLLDFCTGVNIIGEATGVQEGIELLRSTTPDLILLDIEMSDGDGFDILNAFGDTPLNVIFVTGYDQYAIKAIKYAALDYLLKPVELQELKIALEKFRQGRASQKEQFHFLQTHYSSGKEELQKIVLPGRDRYIVVDLKSIIRIEAQGSYVVIYLDDHKSHIVVNSLSYYEELLPAHLFFRIHKSHLINLTKVQEFDTGRKGKVRLNDGSELDIAVRRRSAFNQLLKQSR